MSTATLTPEDAARVEASPEEIAPDTGKPMTKANITRFAIGFATATLVMATSGTIGSGVLFPNRFNTLGIGQPEAILGAMNSVGCVVALFANIIFGALSDHCHSRFGKRTPFIVIGGLITGASFWLTSQAASFFGIVFWWSMLQVGLNMMIAPISAVLSDRVSLKQRGGISAVYGAGGTVGASLGTMLGAAFIQNPLPGFIAGTVGYGIVGLLVVLIWPKEQSAAVAEDEREAFDASALLKSFAPPTKNCRDFYLALFGRLMLVFGYMVIYQYQLYILEKYIGLTDVDAGAVLTGMSFITMIVSLVFSLAGGVISDKMGARKPLIALASVLLAIGVAAPWILKSTLGMYAFALVGGIGYGMYSSVDQPLLIDVLPNKEEAGKDLGILNIASTVGQVVAPLVTSNVVLATGSYFYTFPVSIALILGGVVFIMFIKNVK